MPDETPWHAIDVLSPVVRDLLSEDGVYRELVGINPVSASRRKTLSQLPPDQLLARPAPAGADLRPLMAGLWLWCDGLEESHAISQALSSPTGSFWHAIMHRREGDFSNAKYWYARCRHHPALARIATLIRTNLGDAAVVGPLHSLVRDEWDADGFVDVVEAVHRDRNDPLYPTAVRLQQLEWRGLFDHCLAEAVGVR